METTHERSATKSTGRISLLLRKLRDGSDEALADLIPLVYPELRRLAGHHLNNERPGHTLQATALVHEAYIRLIGAPLNWQCRAHFFGVASRIMREILVDYARKHIAGKRGGLLQKVQLDDSLIFESERSEELLMLNDALTRLEKLDQSQSRIVELRYFGGLTGEETAAVMNIAPSTVDREWKMARMWLRRELEPTPKNDTRILPAG